MDITGHTKIVGIFGDPIDHTISPSMHNAAFESLGLDMVYVPFHVKARPVYELKCAVASIRSMNIRGMNITIPHKEKVIKYLDEVDGCAREVGAVNSIVNRNGRLVGFNTDGPGYLLSLKEDTGFTPKRKNIVMLGAGGAARAILYALLDKRPASVVIANRTVKRADSLAHEFRKKFDVGIKTSRLDREALRADMARADILINTTSLGMKGKGSLDLPLEALIKSAVVSDIVYTPLDTDLLKKAKALGLKLHYGLSMLVRQGAITFELWTGKKAPVEVMQRAALLALGYK